jgi:hypothetical protein
MLVLLLGVFLALGTSLAAVKAGEMPSKMTMTSTMGAPGHCSGCGDDGNGDTAKKMVTCSFGCVAPVLAVIPQAAPTRVVQIAALHPRQDSLLLGRASSPDPFPPRSGNL